jgi:hypothetical protein
VPPKCKLLAYAWCNGRADRLKPDKERGSYGVDITIDITFDKDSPADYRPISTIISGPIHEGHPLHVLVPSIDSLIQVMNSEFDSRACSRSKLSIFSPSFLIRVDFSFVGPRRIESGSQPALSEPILVRVYLYYHETHRNGARYEILVFIYVK